MPRLKTYLSTTLADRPVELHARAELAEHYDDLPGTLEDPADPAFHTRRVGTYETYDGQVQYLGVKNLK